MMRSMTGFGRGEARGDGVEIVAEIRSVNNRFLDVNVRAPRELLALEGAAVAAVKGALRRGRVDVHLRRSGAGGRARVVADAALYRSYVDAVDGLLAGSDAPRPDAAFLLAQPGVLTVVVDEVRDDDEAALLGAALGQALDALVAMREAEGAVLRAHLEALVDELAGHADAIRAEVADLDARLRERLEARMRRLVGEQVEVWRIVQEAGLLAEKADVAEELARLDSHVAQVRDALAQGEEVGRRLDFLTQELHREINTLGAKAVDVAVRARIVDMKTLLERLREQAANVE